MRGRKVTKRCGTERTTRSVTTTGRQVLIAQAALLGGVVAVLFLKELPGLLRELRIYRMSGGLRAHRRYP